VDATTLDLVRRAQRADRRAFDELIRRYEATALAVGLGVSGDAAAAGDAAQEGFLRAWRKLGELADAARFGPWLCEIVRHAAIDATRRRRPEPMGELPPSPDATADPAELVDRRERSERVIVALRTLDETARSIVTLRYYQDLSSKQIAELTGLSPAAVDMRLTRARAALREILEPQTQPQGS
jgi:RNA polymerase sigma-70 factor (ECF subfamily)